MCGLKVMPPSGEVEDNLSVRRWYGESILGEYLRGRRGCGFGLKGLCGLSWVLGLCGLLGRVTVRRGF